MVTLFLWRLGIHSYFNFLSGGGRNKNFIETCCIFTPHLFVQLWCQTRRYFPVALRDCKRISCHFLGIVWWSFPFPVAVDAGENLEFTWTSTLDFTGIEVEAWRISQEQIFFFLRSPGTGMWSRESMCVFWGNEVLKHLFAVPLLWTKAY